MELVVRKFDLLKELQLFQGIVERKNTIPILANVLIDAKGEVMRLAATDLEVGLRAECKASIARAGALTLPTKKLFEIVRTAGPDIHRGKARDGERWQRIGSGRLRRFGRTSDAGGDSVETGSH